MNLINKTNFNAKQLMAFVRQVAIHESLSLDYIKLLRVKAIYRKRSCRWDDNHVTGYAYYHTPYIVLKFLKGVVPDKVQMAKTVAHELAHTQGVHHGAAMNNSIYGWKEGWQQHWAWAAGLPLTMNAEPTKIEKTIDTKLAHCVKQKELWERKARLAKTKIRKWQGKIRYYERGLRKAASPAIQENTPCQNG